MALNLLVDVDLDSIVDLVMSSKVVIVVFDVEVSRFYRTPILYVVIVLFVVAVFLVMFAVDKLVL